MLNRQLIAAVSAMTVMESISYYSLTKRSEIINGLIEKLQPYAKAGFDPACYFLNFYHPVATERAAWLAKLPEDYRFEHQTVFRITSPEEQNYFSAVHSKDLASVKKFIAAGVNPFVHTAGNATGTALHEAVRIASIYKKFEILEYMIQVYQDYGYTLNHTVEGHHHTPMGVALHYRSRRAVEMLLNAGVEVSFELWNQHYYHNSSVNAKKIALACDITNTRVRHLTLTVLPVINEKGVLMVESCNVIVVANDKIMPKLTKEKLKTQEIRTFFDKNKLIYKVFDYDIPAEDGFFVLQLIAGKFVTHYYHFNILNFLKDKNISFSLNAKNDFDLFINLPRDSFSSVLNFIFKLHERHVHSISASAPMSEFAVEARAGDMLEMDVCRDKALPSLFDYDYAVLMKSFASEEEKKIYRNFCTIRFHARMFAAGVVNGSLMQAPDSYILSVARVGDLTIHNEVESVQIARENFQRMPSKAYTPRLFLAVPVVEVAPVDIKTPELN